MRTARAPRLATHPPPSPAQLGAIATRRQAAHLSTALAPLTPLERKTCLASYSEQAATRFQLGDWAQAKTYLAFLVDHPNEDLERDQEWWEEWWEQKCAAKEQEWRRCKAGRSSGEFWGLVFGGWAERWGGEEGREERRAESVGQVSPRGSVIEEEVQVKAVRRMSLWKRKDKGKGRARDDGGEEEAEGESVGPTGETASMNGYGPKWRALDLETGWKTKAKRKLSDGYQSCKAKILRKESRKFSSSV